MMSETKKLPIVLSVLFLLGCETQQMGGGPQSPSSQTPSSPSVSIPSPSPTMPSSGSQSSSSSSSQSGSPQQGSQTSSGSQDQTSGGSESIGSNSGQMSSGSSSSPSGQSSQSSGSMGGSQRSASSIFKDSLGDFDKDIASERVVIASADRGDGMTGQESADAAAISEGALEGGMGSSGAESEISEGQEGESTESQSESDSSDESSQSEADKQKERIPDDIPMDGTGEDVIARQIREAAIQEDDPVIREALWEEYRKHMGIKK
ncbi:MAG TPA: hypothetical protein QGG41_06145 [Gammaproteobacteria bacterium]|nr:hypothetical protein [Gammaproteobacteria bacterium]